MLVKKDRRRFRQYILTQAESQYKKSAKPYLYTTNEHVSYLGTLIDLVDRYKHTVKETASDDRCNLIEMMAISCVHSKLFFGKSTWTKEGQESTAKQFEAEVNQLYHDWDSLMQTFTLCQRYIDRGTTDLDRTAANAAFTSDGDMIIHYCLGKPWLLPLSHIILTHDAQYQMKGNKKYKKEILLYGNADPLMLSSLPPEKQKKVMKATYSCAFKIRNILRDFFASKGKNTFKTDCKAAFVNYFSEKASKKLGQKVITDD